MDPKTGVLDFADGKEWCVLKLGVPGVVKKIEVDTNHFKGNFPDSIGSMTLVLEQQFWLHKSRMNFCLKVVGFKEYF